MEAGVIETVLLSATGDDLTIVNAARQSFDKKSTEFGQYEQGLLNALMREGHAVPFEHPTLSFHIRCPIGVARELTRHRWASYSEQSTRYVKMEPKFYIPEGSAARRQVGKPMAYTFEPLLEDVAFDVRIEMIHQYNLAYNSYNWLLKQGLAKEVARNVLPLGLFTSLQMTLNLRSLFNVLSLRTAPNALEEAQMVARAMEVQASEVYPAAFSAWNDFGRRAI